MQAAAAFCQDPLESHVWTTWPLHCVAPGLQVPEHAPPLHTFVQMVPLSHAPEALQVSGVRPLQSLAPGVHTPVHAPPTQAWFVQAAAVPYCPLALQVWTPLPVH
jgi:hypothetical protein